MKSGEILKSKSIVNILLTLVGAILLVALGISLNTLFSSRSQQTSQTANQSEVLTAQQISPTPTPIVEDEQPNDSPTRWQTYSNSEFEYSMKYPPAEIKELGADAINLDHVTFVGTNISVLVNKLPWDEVREDVIYLMLPSQYKVTKEQVGGRDALHIFGEAGRIGDVPDENPRLYVDQYLVRVGDLNYLIHFHADPDSPQRDQQLARFREVVRSIQFSTGTN